eukprot:TRINITY_DN4868_c0_g2_i1.p1 TRINITY_DN4868_c0_g2~~TRINITY_DN4868_c0_g2_i1.p1  ORF type:complete len:414 (+),score=35.23 TRINITY_DN4868_c0_g2_i1:180-1244(+)
MPSTLHCLPIVSSGPVHFLHMCLACGCAVFYTWCAICPPAWAAMVCKRLHFPDWMQFTFGSVMMICMAGSIARASVARSILFNSDMVNLFYSNNPVEMRSQPRWHLWGLNFPLAALSMASLILIFPSGRAIIVFLLPAFVVIYIHGGVQGVVFDTLLCYSMARAEALCHKLDIHDWSDEAEPCSYLFWQQLTEEHRDMHESFETVWSLDNGGLLLLCDVFLRMFFASSLLACAAGCQHQVLLGLLVSVATLTAITLLGKLYPLARITSLCQSRGAGDRSILRLALKFVNDKHMSESSKAEHARFLQYISAAPAGIDIPIVGLITTDMIVSYAKTLAALAPIALTYIVKIVVPDD